MAMANQHRTRANQIVDVFVATLIPYPATLPFGNHHLPGQIAKGASRQTTGGKLRKIPFPIRYYVSCAPTREQTFPDPIPDSPGIPKSVRDEVVVAPFNEDRKSVV